MKKAFLMVLACLLLAGCGAPSETVTPTDSWPDSALAETNEAAAESPPEPISTAPAESPPATAPADPLPAPAVVTAGQAPEEPYDLPTEVIGLKDWIGESRWNHDPVGLLAELPERELSLYGVTKWLDSSAPLRWGQSGGVFLVLRRPVDCGAAALVLGCGLRRAGGGRCHQSCGQRHRDFY